MLNQNTNYEITHSELRKFKGFEHVSDEAASEICLQLRELSLIFYDIFQLETTKQAKREISIRALKPK